MRRGFVAPAAFVMLLAAATSLAQTGSRPNRTPSLSKIRHVVFIMQENRSFDGYFGTYPGADGFPRDAAGNIAVCVPDPMKHTCVKPYRDPSGVNAGGPHIQKASIEDVDGGKMDGFIRSAEAATPTGTAKCLVGLDLVGCSDPAGEQIGACLGTRQLPGCVDVMGYHDRRDIPNYWKYADEFVLQDHMFEPVDSWSLPAHLYMVSAWSASCSRSSDPSSCTSDPAWPADWDGIPPVKQVEGLRALSDGLMTEVYRDPDDAQRSPLPPDYAWTDITYLLHKHGVSWRYYIEKGKQPDCPTGMIVCVEPAQNSQTPEIWNPLPEFTDVHADGELGNVVDAGRFTSDVASNNLPAVSWVIPSSADSEHPPSSIGDGQAHVTNVINAIMNSPEWSSTAIFLSWDDWGGFYDHVVPPAIGGGHFGIRVPGLVISPYARSGFIDHQQLSFDAYLKFIEDVFLGGARLDPLTDGRPDPRPMVRESDPRVGDLVRDFNFDQAPRPPILLPPGGK